MTYLKKLSEYDGIEIYHMLQEIGANENGFHNKVYKASFDDYKKWLKREYAVEHGKLENWMVPQTSFWMFENDEPIGYGRIRHSLNETLEKTGGHIGYAIRKSRRGQGYGNKLLQLLISECKGLGITQIQISANADNVASNKVILRNGGVLFRKSDGKNFYYVFPRKGPI